MSRVFIGIDPGVTGAIAFITSDWMSGVEDLPIITDGTHRWVDAVRLALIIQGMNLSGAVAFVERTQAMPKQGVSSTFTGGMILGSILAGLAASGCAIKLVQPSKWKRDSKLSSDKSVSLGRARLSFPSLADRLARKKDHNRAEALLLADWGRLHG